MRQCCTHIVSLVLYTCAVLCGAVVRILDLLQFVSTLPLLLLQTLLCFLSRRRGMHMGNMWLEVVVMDKSMQMRRRRRRDEMGRMKRGRIERMRIVPLQLVRHAVGKQVDSKHRSRRLLSVGLRRRYLCLFPLSTTSTSMWRRTLALG